MKNVKNAVLVAVSLLLILSGTPAAVYAGTEQEESFSREELVQMLSPIALYPDSLLAQILMASTYPLELVEAERWLRKNKGLEGNDLYEALLDKDWDTSIKSLCNFPDVIFALSDKIEQTRRLGDAFLAQEDEIMDVVQELRSAAYERGSLKSTKQQKVTVENKVILVEPALSNVIYVPVYDPLYVYGPWRYPACPPYYWYYPSGYGLRISYISFGSPILVSAGWFSWAWFDWPFLRIYISFNDACRYHRHYTCRYEDDHHWRHDPQHRRSVDYRDRNTADRFGRTSPGIPDDRTETRISRPDTKVNLPDSDRDESRKKSDSPQFRPDKEKAQPDTSEDASTVVSRHRTESSSTPAKRSKDRDADSFRAAPEKIQAPLPENTSFSDNAGSSFDRKSSYRYDRDSDRDTKLSFRDATQQTNSARHDSDRYREKEDSGKKGRGRR